MRVVYRIRTGSDDDPARAPGVADAEDLAEVSQHEPGFAVDGDDAYGLGSVDERGKVAHEVDPFFLVGVVALARDSGRGRSLLTGA